jgi:hypothetical protein
MGQQRPIGEGKGVDQDDRGARETWRYSEPLALTKQFFKDSLFAAAAWDESIV